jgi:hypothetical protein
MTNSQRRLEQAIEAAQEYRRIAASGDVVRAEQVSRVIDDLVGYWEESQGHRFLTWPSVVARVVRGEAR